MSQENVEVVRQMNAAFNRGDLAEAFAFYDPAAIWHSRSDEPDTGDYRGLDAIRAMAQMWGSMFSEFEFDLDDDFVAVRDYVVTSGWLGGRGRVRATRDRSNVRPPGGGEPGIAGNRGHVLT